jgi:hypothetical protein
MKKIILALSLLFIVGSTLNVSAQGRVKFYYYPSSNVYYNVSTGEYWYYDEPAIRWVEVRTLPSNITIAKTRAYTVYYNGRDVWKNNAVHKNKYKKGGGKKKGNRH